MRRMRFPLSILVATSLAVAGPLTAQTVTAGKLSGLVSASDGSAQPNVVITLRSQDSGFAQETTTDLQGRYTVEFVAPGVYDVRAEAFGFRPVVLLGVRVDAGQARTLNVGMTPAPPPVETVDTVPAPVASASRWSGSGPVVSTRDVDEQRSLLGGLPSLGRFSSAMDPYLGALGLPGELTALAVDGVPFFQARHPFLRGEDLGSPAFPTAFLSRAAIQMEPSDVYWQEATGASVTAETRSGAGSVDASWTGKPLWSSGVLNLDSPTLMSVRGGAQGGVTLAPDTSRIFVAGEALRQQSPLAPRLADAGVLEGLDPATLSGLGAPSVETISRASGMARLDRVGESSRFTLRASGGRTKRDYDAWGPGHLDYGVGTPEEATDLSAAMALTSQYDNRVAMEFLAGVSLSDRTYGASDAVPAASLLSSGASLGSAASSYAKVSRTDAFLSPAAQLPLGPGRARVGATIHGTKHTFDQILAGGGEAFFPDANAVVNGDGYLVSGKTSETSFSTSRVSLFGQYRWDAAPGLQIVAGARFDRENIPASEVAQSVDWLKASGVANDTFPSRFSTVGGLASLSWDVRQDGRTMVFGSASVSHGNFDPGLVHELAAQDGAATMRRFVGTGLSWPDQGTPSAARTAPILTLLGPDGRPPQTAEFSGGIVQDLGSGWSLHASATVRRTDFLPRRRDVNLPLYPLAVDNNGRDVFGDLRKVGSMVVADPGSNRRFDGFDVVWAVDPDGWSRYRGASLGLQYADARANAFVSYTHSQTEDNWVGAARGLPDATMDPLLPDNGGTPWSEGVSDFDIPDRLVVGARMHLDVGAGAELAALYTWASGRPFTPGYRTGVDINGDGSVRNDVAFVPDVSTLGDLAGSWSCLSGQAGSFAERNSCRGPTRSTLDASLSLGVAATGGHTVYLTVEGFNLIESKSGIIDQALLLVNPSQPIQRSADGSTVTVPVTVNPNFGQVIVPDTRGRILRVGLRIGG